MVSCVTLCRGCGEGVCFHSFFFLFQSCSFHIYHLFLYNTLTSRIQSLCLPQDMPSSRSRLFFNPFRSGENSVVHLYSGYPPLLVPQKGQRTTTLINRVVVVETKDGLMITSVHIYCYSSINMSSICVTKTE